MTLSSIDRPSSYGYGEQVDVTAMSERLPTSQYDRASELGGSAVSSTIQERELGYKGDDTFEGNVNIILGDAR